MTKKLYDRPSDIPDYKSKRIRLWSWVPRGYCEFIDGEWWHNSLASVEGLPRYELKPGPDPNDNPNFGWEEYVEWKAELRQELSSLRHAIERRYHRTMRQIWIIEDKIEKM